MAYLLDSELSLSHRNAIDELECGPKTMELGAFIDIDDAINRGLAVPYRVIQEGLDLGQNDLKNGEATTESLTRQQIPFSSNLSLLGISHLVNILHNLKSSKFGLQSLLLCLGLFSLFAGRPWKNVLEGSSMKEIHDLFLGKGLLYHQTEQDSIAKFTEIVKELGPGIRILCDVLQSGLWWKKSC